MEGDRAQSAGSHADDIWVVVKSRDVGEPAPRLCEAEMQHRGNTQLPRLLASAIWADLPGEPRWALFDEVGTSATAGAKLHRPASGGSPLAPCSLKAQGTLSSCTALYVAHMPNVSAPALRKPYLGKIRRREREGAKLWRRSARAEAIGLEAPTCPADIARQTVVAPRLYTSQGLRAALASSVCSRACAASRLRGLDANRTRRAGEPQPCLLGGEQAGCDLRRGNVLLVVSHWNADLRHLREQPFCYVVFEKRGNAQKHVIDFSVANKANEASTYLHFLLHFFDELPETMLFLQDGRTSAHNPDVVGILRHLRLDAAAYLPLNSVHVPFLSPSAFCHVERCLGQAGVRRFLPSGALPRHQMDVAYTCCAQFLVTRDAVRAHPRQLYEELQRYALGASDFGHRGDSFARGECLEILWHVLFGRPRVDAPVPPATMCGEAAAGQCVRTTGLKAFAPADDPFWSWAAPLWERSSSEERTRMRAGQLSPFDAAARRGLRPPPRSANCSVLEAQNNALVSRRKLRSTLQQVCRGRASAGSAASSLPLHDRALCALYDTRQYARVATSNRKQWA